MQSSSGNYSMRHQVPMVFLVLLIYLSAVTCISEERNLDQCWRKDILRVKVKHKSKIVTFCELAQSNELTEWPLSDAPTSIHFFKLLLLYLITVACILEISLGSCWHKDECMGQRSTINHNVQLFISLNNQYAIIMIIQWPPVEIYMCKLCPNQISITIWKFTTWVCIEHEVEVATSTRKHWLVYGI